MEKFITSQKITTLQLHIYPTDYYSFHNRFFVDGFKWYANGITVTIVQHQHPLHQLSQLPFVIVNQAHVVPKQQLLSVLQSISSLQATQLIYFFPIYQLCQQLAGVGRIMSQQSNNPYYLLISPHKKYEIYVWNKQFHKKFYQQTQYFYQSMQSYKNLKQWHFLYKLNILTSMISKLDRFPIIVFCVASLMNSLLMDNVRLYEMSEKHNILKKCEEQGSNLRSLKVIPRNQNKVNQFYNVNDPNEQIQKKEKINSTIQFKSVKTNIVYFILPISGFVVFWKLHNLFQQFTK